MDRSPARPSVPRPDLPPLPLEEWEETKDTLRLYVQVLGKVRLASAPPKNHWWHAPLYVSARGLTTRLVRDAGVHFEVELDLIDHAVEVRSADGSRSGFEVLDGLTVSDFHARTMAALDRIGAHPVIRAVPYGVDTRTPFAEDREPRRYDAEMVGRFRRILLEVNDTLEEFAGRYSGKSSPVHLFWHSFDLVLTRFSGRQAPVDPGTDGVTAEAYSHEVISFGFWPGDLDVRAPAFYSYTAPEPAGLADRPLQPIGAHWRPSRGSHLALYWYDDYRAARDPRASLLDFLESAYAAGAAAAGWDASGLASGRGTPAVPG